MLGGLFKHLCYFPFIAIYEQLPWLEEWQTVNGKFIYFMDWSSSIKVTQSTEHGRESNVFSPQ